MEDGLSEIDDPNFFLSKNGKTNAKNELEATLHALLNEKSFDDNSTACQFPARKRWLQETLNISDFPKVTCKNYDNILKRLDPKSVTLVFPSAHINSPASMFGHTFLRINSSYNSKLLSYAINYAADADADTTNGVVFAIKGLFGGYYGRYSLLPYYEKLKEYRDAEQRDIWEYDLNLKEDEVVRMIEHIWELNGTHSDYFFFTENCSYNMLWFLEVARPSLNLREKFNVAVIPLETVHVAQEADLIESHHFRPSKRTTLLGYEAVVQDQYIPLVKDIVDLSLNPQIIIEDESIPLQQKMYILESAREYSEYKYTKNTMQKEQYLSLFHQLSQLRASLGSGENLDIKTPSNPINSHRAVRINTGVGSREGKFMGFLGIRSAYHDLEDSNYGFLRGTQIEFLNLDLSYGDDTFLVEKATIVSIVSLAQRSEFFSPFAWRMKLSFDREFLDDETNFILSLGAGYSWGNALGYSYFMLDPLLYGDTDITSGIGGSIGFVIDYFDGVNTNFEATSRYYDTGKLQYLGAVSQSFQLSQNLQIQLKYNYIEKYVLNEKVGENTSRLNLNYYF